MSEATTNSHAFTFKLHVKLSSFIQSRSVAFILLRKNKKVTVPQLTENLNAGCDQAQSTVDYIERDIITGL